MDKLAIQQFRKSLRRLERRLGGQLEGKSLCCGVTTAQCHTLLAIEEKGLTTTTELATELELDKSTLSRTIDGLVAVGLANRETDSSNRRSQHISLTSQGERVTASINERWNHYFESLFNRLPESKRRTLLEGITILSDAMLSPKPTKTKKGDKPRMLHSQLAKHQFGEYEDERHKDRTHSNRR